MYGFTLAHDTKGYLVCLDGTRRAVKKMAISNDVGRRAGCPSRPASKISFFSNSAESVITILSRCVEYTFPTVRLLAKFVQNVFVFPS